MIMQPQQPRGKITVTWTDLNSRKVSARIAEQDAIVRQKQSQEHLSDYETMAAETDYRPSIWYNPLFSMAVFGLLGALFAWASGEALLGFRPTDKVESAQFIDAAQSILARAEAGRFSPEAAEAALKQLELQASENDYFLLALNSKLTPEEKDRAKAKLELRDQRRDFIANLLSYAVTAMFLAIALGMAESIVDRNMPGMVITGSVGATLGLLGGVLVSLFVENLYRAVGGGADGQITPAQIFARSVSYGVLGMFLAAAPGLVMRNFKKLQIGLLGGLLGGLIGGALFDPVAMYAENPQISRLVALVTIGIVTGLACGLIENATKTGWLRVVSGLIAGKQFILYRNPTFIGSSPDCQIYLFKDRKVGKRHAAIHIVPGGFELEDLPLGVGTIINGKDAPPRVRLRHGDELLVGSTRFLFQEKNREAETAA